jgi:hypothetical protein
LLAEAELEVREVYDVALPDEGVGDAVAVDEGAVGAVQVTDAQILPLLVDLRVFLRDRLRGEGQAEAGSAPDLEGQGMYGEAPQLLPAIDEAFQEPSDVGGAAEVRGRV